MLVALAFQGPISSWGQQSALCCIVLVLPLILEAVEGAVKTLCSYSDFSSAVKRPSLAALLQRAAPVPRQRTLRGGPLCLGDTEVWSAGVAGVKRQKRDGSRAEEEPDSGCQ